MDNIASHHTNSNPPSETRAFKKFGKPIETNITLHNTTPLVPMNIRELYRLENPNIINYTTAHIVTHTTAGEIHSNMVFSSRSFGQSCFIRYQFPEDHHVHIGYDCYFISSDYRDLTGSDTLREEFQNLILDNIVEHLKITDYLFKIHGSNFSRITTAEA